MNTREQAKDLYFQGRLPEAVESQLAWVRDNPMDLGARLFLVELLSFQGQWDRAERQLKALLSNKAEEDAAVLLYIGCVAAERKRAEAFSGGQKPKILGSQTASIELRLSALGLSAEDAVLKIREAEALEAGRDAALSSFTFNDQPFHQARDGDDLLGPVLEVFAQGEYFWADLAEVKLISIEKPRFPRDLIWLPARLEMENEAGNVFLPTMYLGSTVSTDPELQLGRATDWAEAAEGQIVRGLGQKEWFFDQQTVIPVVEWQSMERA